MARIRVLLVDEKESARRGLRMSLELEPDIEVVGAADDLQAALRAAGRLQPDVIVVDVVAPHADVATTQALCEALPACAVVVLSMHDGAATRARAAAAGASAFVAKHELQPGLIDAIRRAAGRSTPTNAA